ncbi:MAG: LPXTG cell wall anchor domain-containing protein [Ruminococcus sp.]|nr:LPXTG cell wall anchor domain-containing protein [Ruminococcus sp.]
MKKNVFSRTLAVLASTAVLGAASMMSASAATAATVSVSSAEATPGSTVTLTVDVACGNDLEAFDVVVTWDGSTGLAATGKAKSVDPENWTVTSEYGDGFATVVCYGTDTLADGSFASIEFQVPEDAEVGTTYAVQILPENITTVSSMTDGEVESVTPADGTITVVAPETGAPETTAAETTAAATTTTKATTKAAAPKTGNAGVAVAVAGLVAAGATAVVLKKRH